VFVINKFLKNRKKLPFEFSINSNNNNFTRKNLSEKLRNNYSIEYKAPMKASNTKLKSNYFNLVTANATCEHIPENDILSIFNECYRLLIKGGICLFNIDYKDHWSYSDYSITIYNFLKFSDNLWNKYNPSINYQSRLRHKDYIKLISKTQFKIIEDNADYANEDERRSLESIIINQKYENYTKEELGIKGSHIVLIKE